MRKEDLKFAKAAEKRLALFETQVHSLPGIANNAARDTFIFQMIESMRRIRFVDEVSKRPISDARKNPQSEFFDPIRAAILYQKAGNVDEACWLVFLFVHFGKNAKSGYHLIADVYGRLGQGRYWNWQEAQKDTVAFRHWLDQNRTKLKSSESIHRGFGNHRKYQSLDAWKPAGTGEAIESYVRWVKGAGGHRKLFDAALELATCDPEKTFKLLYNEMDAVSSFGRTAKFDYLAMIGKLGLAVIRPDSVHFVGATGPVTGAKLMFFGDPTRKQTNRTLQDLSDALATFLNVDKQVIEDSLCNWQKSPLDPVRFRG